MKKTDPVQEFSVTTRERLLTEATLLIDAAGRDGVTMRAVSARVGLSAMAIYKHFPDKRALLTAIATEDFYRVGAAMDSASSKRTEKKDYLVYMMRAYVKYAVAHPVRYGLMFDRDISAAQDPRFADAAMGVYKRIENAVSRCIATLAIPTPANALAGVILATAHGAIDLHIQGHVTPLKGLGDPEKLVARLISLMPF
jgi:AcrR family transcriptional regulator